jgi:hypothetical protein
MSLTTQEKSVIHENLKKWNGPHCWGFYKGYRLSLSEVLKDTTHS